MSEEARSWAGMVREVGEAFLALVRAEVTALTDDLRSSGRGLTRVLVLGAIAAALLFWAVALLVDLLVELVALALPRWGSMTVVLVVLVGVALGFAGAARQRLRALETPAETLRRRIEESRGWWRSRIEAESDDGETS